VRAKRVGVVGAGYAGLTTAACFAHLGHRVNCADADTAKIEALNAGEITLHEPGLRELVEDNRERPASTSPPSRPGAHASSTPATCCRRTRCGKRGSS
jgi:UDP-glucose 6-dehydrogenase